MAAIIANVDDYLSRGCGRCSLFDTPQCKVHSWTDEIKQLREIVRSVGLEEVIKWGAPCYTFEGKNIAMVSAVKNCAVMSFFKGSLLQDSAKILEKPGENSQSARLLRFRSVASIRSMEESIQAFLREAIELEKQGAKVDFAAKHELVYPEELTKKMDALPAFRDAFLALTPGRQRGYVLYFSGAKQSKTRESRIEKSMPAIFEGRGLHDHG